MFLNNLNKTLNTGITFMKSCEFRSLLNSRRVIQKIKAVRVYYKTRKYKL